MGDCAKHILFCAVVLLGCCVIAQAEEAASTATAEEKPASDSPAAILAGHSTHGEAFNEGPRQAAQLIAGTGRVHFPITTKEPLAQQFFDQGVGQLHGFWYLEAERSFRQVAMLDPECAMAYWGMTLANGGNETRAKKFLAEAILRKAQASPREQQYLNALDAYYKLDSKKNKERGAAYAKALEAIALEYPDDIEAKAMLGVQLWFNRGNEIPISSHLAVDALFKQVLAIEPLHPCHHYLIHLWDHEKAAMALDAAAKCGPAAPAIAHMWHMPGHIYSDLHRYADAAWQQEASARVDHAYMIRDRLMPDQIHNFAHNNEWLIRDLNFIGRTDDALSLAKNMIELPRHPKYNTTKRGSANYGRLRLFETLSKYELWAELIALADTRYLVPTDIEAEQIKRWQYQGIAHFRLGQKEQGHERMAELAAFVQQQTLEQAAAITKALDRVRLESADGTPPEPTDLAAAQTPALTEGEPPLPGDSLDIANALPVSDALKKKYAEAKTKAQLPWKAKLDAAEKARKQLEGFAFYADGNFVAAYAQLKKAGGVDECFLIRAQREAGEKEQAETAARELAKKKPGEILPLIELIDQLWQSGKRDEATTQFTELRKLAGHADLYTPPLQRMTAIAAQLNLPVDWRLPGEPAADLGERPSLETLGPYRWHPAAAPAWALKDVAGKPLSLQDYSGRPVIVIFYLGHGCLHCAEQLQAFGPRTADFAKAGVELVAISTDNPEKLEQSHKNYQPGAFPFPLVSDAPCEAFKAYRAYDDFEGQPLHATFLIDGDGLIRWQDIGHEPYKDVDFLLAEAQRLLALPKQPAETTTAAAK